MIFKKVCVICNNEYITHVPHQKTCSKRCRNKHCDNRNKYNRLMFDTPYQYSFVCLNCSNEFLTFKHMERYCSIMCRMQRRHLLQKDYKDKHPYISKPKIKYCVDCGIDISFSGNRKYRCDICQKKYNKMVTREYEINNREYRTKQKKEWSKNNPEKTRLIHKKHDNKRERELGFIILFDNPFSDSEIIDWHHIDNNFVVAIPKDLHQLYLGKNHRELLKTLIKQIYEF